MSWFGKRRTEEKKIAILVDYENISQFAAEQGKIIDLDAISRHCLETLGMIEFAFLFVPIHLVSYQLPNHLPDQGFYPVACKSRNGKEKDRVDTIMTEVGMKLVEHSDIDILVIVSHDGDFVRLANFAKFHKKKTVVLADDEKISYLLKQVVDIIYPLPVKIKQ